MENRMTGGKALSSFIAGTITLLLVIFYVELMVKAGIWFWGLL